MGIHELMRGLKAHLGKEKELFLVGEISSDELPVIHSYAGNGGLDTTFNFNMGSMERFDFDAFYGQLEQMVRLYDGDIWPTVFFGSHDMARFPSRFRFSVSQAKNLFTLMMTYRAIPFIYNGDEIGMENYECREIGDARDIQGIIAYNQAIKDKKSEEEAVRILNEKSRDHSRNTMYWEDTKYGGFSEAEPWIPWQKQKGKSAAEQMRDENSLFFYVARLIRIRTKTPALCGGSCRVENPADGVIIIRRETESEKLQAVINFSGCDFEMEKAAGQGKPELLIETEAGSAAAGLNVTIVRAQSSAVFIV